MKYFQWFDRLSKFVEGHPGLGNIKYGQIKLLAEFVSKETGGIDLENIVREVVSDWAYSGRMGSRDGLELLIKDLTSRVEGE